jgi:hypothetical protein
MFLVKFVFTTNLKLYFMKLKHTIVLLFYVISSFIQKDKDELSFNFKILRNEKAN